MSRTLPPITEPVTHEETVNIFLRTIYSVKDSMDDETMQRLLTESGITNITPQMIHAALDNL